MLRPRQPGFNDSLVLKGFFSSCVILGFFGSVFLVRFLVLVVVLFSFPFFFLVGIRSI